ncbi:type II toxin-antitoxin system HicA family toxin [Pseudarthrobacter sp. MDT3-26]|uniref:type II toxin-antitoxin system HicA family toxin n=1 Tax=Pseudarthrobacter raffinosi TaxID=2953651 RepID=UPI00208F1451|nr:type II toxin-antitoxin system HicA family toxin [Pseudarthrobacter sp. MDT3-26]MCO4262530.1 type II toxin-antitoxin system HicA family toxin [Pseudarthrobacter sp. MDT3-26]
MMKRRELLNQLKQTAKDLDVEYTTEEGGRHTRVNVGDNTTFVPRHNEIGEKLAKQIMKQAKGEDTK